MIQEISRGTAGPSPETAEVFYPDSDGEPMAENTEQWEWIVLLKDGLEWLFADRPDVFVAGDLFWYPIQGDNKTRLAPDVMVALGRPKGRRGSYKQWEEAGIAPQVVFEILSPGNTPAEMDRKFEFYNRFGVQEYYIYDPDRHQLQGWLRQPQGLTPIERMDGWVSPRLGIRFQMAQGTLEVSAANGRPFLDFVTLARQREQERQRAEQERQRAEQEHQRAEQERQRAELEHQRAEHEQQRAEQIKHQAEQESQRAELEHQRAEHEQQRAEQIKQQAEQERQRAERLAAQLRGLGIEPQD